MSVGGSYGFAPSFGGYNLGQQLNLPQAASQMAAASITDLGSLLYLAGGPSARPLLRDPVYAYASPVISGQASLAGWMAPPQGGSPFSQDFSSLWRLQGQQGAAAPPSYASGQYSPMPMNRFVSSYEGVNTSYSPYASSYSPYSLTQGSVGSLSGGGIATGAVGGAIYPWAYQQSPPAFGGYSVSPQTQYWTSGSMQQSPSQWLWS